MRYATRVPSGEILPWKARGSGIGVSTPPSTGTVQKRGAPLGAHVARAGREEHGLAVGRPALDAVGARMPRQPLRLAAVRRHDVRRPCCRRSRALNAIHLPSGENCGFVVCALEARQPARRPARALDDPDVVGVRERDVRRADGGRPQQARGRVAGAAARVAAKAAKPSHTVARRAWRSRCVSMRRSSWAGGGHGAGRPRVCYHARFPHTAWLAWELLLPDCRAAAEPKQWPCGTTRPRQHR